MEHPQSNNVILTLDNVALHTLYAGRKTLKAIGHLDLIDKAGCHWINVNHWYSHEVIRDMDFYKVIYDNYVTYIFENIAGGFYALSISKGDPNLDTLEQKLKQDQVNSEL